MLMMNCYSQEMDTCNADESDYEKARHIRIALCCQYYLSFAVKQGVLPSQIRRDEMRIKDELHGLMGSFTDIEVARSTRSRCDVCAIINLVRRMALSQYMQECRDFILQTQDKETARAEYDWADAFRTFIESAAVDRDSWLGRKVARAVPIMNFVQRHTPILTLVVSEKPAPTLTPGLDCLAVSDLLQLAKEQIHEIRAKGLRVVR